MRKKTKVEKVYEQATTIDDLLKQLEDNMNNLEKKRREARKSTRKDLRKRSTKGSR